MNLHILELLVIRIATARNEEIAAKCWLEFLEESKKYTTEQTPNDRHILGTMYGIHACQENPDISLVVSMARDVLFSELEVEDGSHKRSS